jgi:hypothetical protein
MLRVVQRSALRSRNPKAWNVATAKMPGAEEFCTQEPHFEGEEVFGSQKRKADIPLGSEHESHKTDRVNFSCPRVRTRSNAAASASCNLSDIPKEPSTDLQEHPIPNVNSRTTHVTTIHNTAYKETEWHIARLPKTSTKAFLPNKPLRRRTVRRRSCKAIRTRQPQHTLGLWSTTRRKRTRLWNSSSATMTLSVASKAQNGGG